MNFVNPELIFLAVLTSGLTILIVFVILLWRSLRTLLGKLQHLDTALVGVGQKIPSKEVTRQMGQGHQALAGALSAHKSLIGGLPEKMAGKVAQEVNSGLRPLQKTVLESAKQSTTAINSLVQGFTESHDHFVQALLTLNDDGCFTEWLEGLQRVVNPLETVANAVEDHYRTSENLLARSSEISERWSGHWEQVSQNFKNFSERFEHWTNIEAAHNHDMEQRILARLEEVGKTNHLIGSNLAELQTARTQLMNSNRELSDAVHKVVTNIREISDFNERLNQQHNQILNAQNAYQERIFSWQKEVQTRVDTMIGHLSNMSDRMNKALDRIVEQQAQFQKRSMDSATALNVKMAEAQKAQNGLIKSQERLLNQLTAKVRTLPDKNWQIAQFAILLLIALILGIKALPS